MPLASLTSEELEIVRRALEATFKLFWFDFQTWLVIEPEEMHALLASWPAVDDTDDNSIACTAIFNSLNDLLHGVKISDDESQKILGASRIELSRIYRKWMQARGW